MPPHCLIVFVDNTELDECKTINLAESIADQAVPPAAVVFCTTAPMEEVYLPKCFPSFSVVINSRTFDAGAFEAAFFKLETVFDPVEFAAGHISIFCYDSCINTEYCKRVHDELQDQSAKSWPETLVFKRYERDNNLSMSEYDTIHLYVFPVSIIRVFIESYCFRAIKATANTYWHALLDVSSTSPGFVFLERTLTKSIRIQLMIRPPYAPWLCIRKVEWGSALGIVLPCAGDEVAFVSSITQSPGDETKQDVKVKTGVLASAPRQGESTPATVSLNAQQGLELNSQTVKLDELRILPKKTSPAVSRACLARARAYLLKHPEITITEATLAEFAEIVTTTVDFCVSNAIGAKQNEIFSERVEAHFRRLSDLPEEGTFFKDTIMKLIASDGWAQVCSLMSIESPFAHQILDDVEAPLYTEPLASVSPDGTTSKLTMAYFHVIISAKTVHMFKSVAERNVVNQFAMRYAKACCLAVKYIVPDAPRLSTAPKGEGK